MKSLLIRLGCPLSASWLRAALALAGGAVAVAQAAPAYAWQPTNRRFGFVNETTHGPATGRFEYEQFQTWLTHTSNDHGFDRLDIAHEIEYGLSDRLYSAISLAEWHVEDSASEQATRYDLSAVELKYRFEDPRTAFVGLSVQTEVGVGPAGLAWENTLIVDKVVDRWEVAYNLQVEAGWTGDKLFEFEQDEGEIVQLLGVSYEVQPSLFLGGELVYEIPLPDWESGERTNLLLGPNLSLHRESWALTASSLLLLGGSDDEPAFQLRLVFEVDF